MLSKMFKPSGFMPTGNWDNTALSLFCSISLVAMLPKEILSGPGQCMERKLDRHAVFIADSIPLCLFMAKKKKKACVFTSQWERRKWLDVSLLILRF